jgi:hypothetical protein
VTRLRIKRVNAGRLKLTNVLQGWTSVQTFEGEKVLQEFDLFDPEEYGTGTPTASDDGDGAWEASSSPMAKTMANAAAGMELEPEPEPEPESEPVSRLSFEREV